MINRSKFIAISLILAIGLFLTLGCIGPFTEDDEGDSGLEEHVLTIDIQGNGSTDPAEGTHTYEEGEKVWVQHVPKAVEGWKFNEWEGCDHIAETYPPQCIVNMTEDKEITANFTEQVNESLEQICVDTGGTVDTSMCCEERGDFPNTCGLGGCGACAPEHSHEVKVCNCGESKCFDSEEGCIPYTLNLTLQKEGQGTVEVDGEEVMEWPYQKTYEEDKQIELTASPDEGWQFANWTGDYQGTEEEINVTVDPDKQITANFIEARDTYTLDLEAMDGGTATAYPNQTEYEEGTEITVVATPDEEWLFQLWERSGSARQCDRNKQNCTFTIMEDSMLSAHFVEEFSYRIGACEQLQNMKQDLNGNYTLIKDVNCSETQNWNDGKGFEPIGTKDNEFNGSLNGRDFRVMDLYIDRPDQDYVGLFGAVDSDDPSEALHETMITDLGMENVDITGNSRVGAIAGYTTETLDTATLVDRSYTSGSVTGTEYVGGVVGYTSARIHNSFSTAEVEGDSFVGGLTGMLYSTGIGHGGYINASYSTGNVIGEGANVSGLIGASYMDTYTQISDSYWNVNTTGISSSNGGEGRTTSEMTYPHKEEDNTFHDYNEDIWNLSDHEIVEDHEGNTGYPALQWQIE